MSASVSTAKATRRRSQRPRSWQIGESAGTLLLTLAITGLAVCMVLLLTLVTSMLTFSLPRTNVLLGCVHLLLFGAYLMLMFKP